MIFLQRSCLIEETGEQSENGSTSFTVAYRPPRVTWKELSRKSIEIFEDTLIPGELGAVVVRGALSCNSGEKSETCAVKILKGSAVEVCYRFSNDIYSACLERTMKSSEKENLIDKLSHTLDQMPNEPFSPYANLPQIRLHSMAK